MSARSATPAAVLQCPAFVQQNPPWAQSAAYQSALRDVRNPTAMTLIGRGDPTGRGRGFAFTREDPKKAKEDAANAQGVKAQADGSITGERTHGWTATTCWHTCMLCVCREQAGKRKGNRVTVDGSAISLLGKPAHHS